MAYASCISKGSCRCTACIAWSSAMLVPSMRATRRCHGVFRRNHAGVFFWFVSIKGPPGFFRHPVSFILSSWIWIRKKTYGLWKMHFDALTPWLCMQFCESPGAFEVGTLQSLVIIQLPLMKSFSFRSILTCKLCFRYGWSVDIIVRLCVEVGDDAWTGKLVPVRSCEFFFSCFLVKWKAWA